MVLLVFLFAVPSKGPRAQEVTANVFFNVFQIRVPGATGTAFTMVVDGRQYLITAKHMVRDLKVDGSQESIEIRKIKEPRKSLEWKRLTVRIFACDDPIDIAVLVTPELVRETFALEPTPNHMNLSQEGYFLGFPLGYASATGGSNFPFPFPFTKKGNLSLVSYDDEAERMFFDGYNNHGFSGGPVVYRENIDSKGHSQFYVAGVISGFIPELAPIASWRPAKTRENLAGIEKWRIEKRDDGRTYVLEDTRPTALVPLNTGIITAFGIKHAVDLIKVHGIGPIISEAAPSPPAL